MTIYITGSNGFIGRNLTLFLQSKKIKIIQFKKKDKLENVFFRLKSNDTIVHLAGQNRSKNPKNFIKNNINLTKNLSDFIIKKKIKIKFIFASTKHSGEHKIYTYTKKLAEKTLHSMQKKTSSNLIILRLPNIFGKWSKPNYNSVVSTFCYNISRSKKIKIINKDKKIELLYIDDLINQIYALIIKNNKIKLSPKITNIYSVSIKDLAEKIYFCHLIFKNKLFFDTGNIFLKNLYSTYLSFLNFSRFAKKIKKAKDHRGDFVEFMKDRSFGQFSFLTINKKKVRGNHYHNSKIERFLIITGKVKFNLECMRSNSKRSQVIDSKSKNFIEIPPGWAHNIQNLHNGTSVLGVWANELYDKSKPDTYIKDIS